MELFWPVKFSALLAKVKEKKKRVFFHAEHEHIFLANE